MEPSPILLDGSSIVPIWTSLFVVLLVLVIAPRRRVRQARAAPAPGVARVSVADLKARLAALATPDGPIHHAEESDRTVLQWQLHGIPWATLLFRRKLGKTQALELRPTDDGRVLVRFQEGRI